MESEEFIEIGTIVAAQGLKGEVRVKSNSDFPERFEEAGERWLQSGKYNQPQSIELISGYSIPGKDIYVLELEGIENRTQAEMLRGSKLLVKKSDRPYLEDDEYHVSDLINLEVFNQLNGENIGIVIDVFIAGNDLLEVRLHKQPELVKDNQQEIDRNNKITRVSKKKKMKLKKTKEATVLIPFVKEIVPLVDLQNGRIEINPPDGLL